MADEKRRLDALHTAAALRLQRNARGLLARSRVRKLVFDKIFKERRERERAAAVRVQLLARLRHARVRAAAQLQSHLAREEEEEEEEEGEGVEQQVGRRTVE